MKQWIWSDTHFNHDRIIELSVRPFAHVTEMNEHMLALYQERVRPGDTVYHLGDVIYPPKHQHHITFDELGARMPGNNILVQGNHDRERMHKALDDQNITEHWMWTSVHDYMEISFGKSRFVLCHYPLETWRNAHHGWYHLHGHCHGNLKRVIPHRIDVGVDALPDYGPIELEKVRDYLAGQKAYEPQDHHS